MNRNNERLQLKIAELEKYLQTILSSPMNTGVKRKIIHVLNDYKSHLYDTKGNVKFKTDTVSTCILEEILKEININLT